MSQSDRLLELRPPVDGAWPAQMTVAELDGAEARAYAFQARLSVARAKTGLFPALEALVFPRLCVSLTRATTTTAKMFTTITAKPMTGKPQTRRENTAAMARPRQRQRQRWERRSD